MAFYKDTQLKLACQNLVSFPLETIQESEAYFVDISSNFIGEWPSQGSLSKNKCLKDLQIAQNFLTSLPAHIISSFSYLNTLNLRDNRIESLPSFSKRCNMLRFLTHLDLGKNLLKIIPSSFLMSISFKTTES